MSVTVVVAGFREPLLLRGVLETLEDDPRLSVVSAGSVGATLEVLVRRARPAVLILDDSSEHFLLRLVKRSGSPVGVIVLVGEMTPLCRGVLRGAGVELFGRGRSPQQLVAAVLRAARVPDASIATPRSPRPQSAVALNEALGLSDELTQRETEVLEHLLGDWSYAAIAHELVVSVATVKTHAASIRRKFGVSSREELRRAVATLRQQALSAA
jgi:DNA-binding NarL/FixJ family response regulator